MVVLYLGESYFMATRERFLNHRDLHAQKITQETMKNSCPSLTRESDRNNITHDRFYEYQTRENDHSYKMSIFYHKNMSISVSTEAYGVATERSMYYML
jgi:hypothetical protein